MENQLQTRHTIVELAAQAALALAIGLGVSVVLAGTALLLASSG